MSDIANVVAILTAFRDGGTMGAGRIIYALSQDELLGVACATVGMLMRELELGCADAGITVDEYLQLAGLAAANGAEL